MHRGRGRPVPNDLPKKPVAACTTSAHFSAPVQIRPEISISKRNAYVLRIFWSGVCIRHPRATSRATLKKRLALPILRQSHFAHSKRVGRSPLARQRTTNTRPYPKTVMLFKTAYLPKYNHQPPFREAYD